MGTFATWTRYSTSTGERYIKSVIKDDDDGCVMAAAARGERSRGTHSNSRARAAPVKGTNPRFGGKKK